MFDKLKKLWLKFNKKENEEKIETKKKTKLSGFMGLVAFSLILTFLLDAFGVLDALKGPSNNSSSSIGNTTKTIEEDFIIEDFIYENYLSKQEDNAYMYQGLKEVKEHFEDFITIYASYSLKDLEGKDFILEGNKFTYEDNNYEYTYNMATKTIEVVDEDIKYQNLNNIIKVNIKDEYQVVLEDTTLSFIYGEDNEYIFELEDNNFTVTSSEGKVIEHYLLDNCALYYYETSLSGHIYNTYVFDLIKKDKNVIYNEEDGLYYLENSNDKVYDFNLELETPNYYASTMLVYDNNKIEKEIVCINVLQSYVLEHGLPLGLSL